MISCKKLSIVSLLAVLLVTTSCVETVILGSAATGTVVARDKSLKNTTSDISISTKVATKFLIHGLKNYGDSVDVTVNEGRVLLTGIVRDVEKAKSASKLAWEVKGVKEVIDEIQVRDNDYVHLKDYAIALNDYRITSVIESKMLFDDKILTLNYQTTTVAGTVYFLGVAQSSAEKNKLLSIASKVRGVKQVVDHVLLASDNRRNG